jgi:hypothetical protein
MIDLSQDIRSLRDFKRNPGEFLTRMKRSGHPVVLTVNGKAELVVHDIEKPRDVMPHTVRITARAPDEIDAALVWLVERSRPVEISTMRLRNRQGTRS